MGATMDSPPTRRLFRDLLDSTDDDADIDQLVVGAFTVGCVSRRLGLASLARPPVPEHAARPVKEAGQLLPSSARALTRRLLTGSTLEASIAMAALNSLIEPPLAQCVERNAARLLAQRGADGHIAVIGHFPFVDRLRESARRVDVFELAAGRRTGDLDTSQAPSRLPEADVVAITGTALTNGTLEGILADVRPDAFVALIGASAPLHPVLFDHGIDALCGAYVPDPAPTLAALAQGATFRQLPGVQRLILLKP